MTRTRNNTRNRALTLVELAVVIVLIALFLSLLAPTLSAARSRSKTDVCLSNLKSLGNAFRMYAESYEALPGPAHPAIYQDQTTRNYPYPDENYIQYMLNRQIAHMLSSIIDRSESERIIACPVMAGIQTESFIREYTENTNRLTFPTHYCVNNWASSDSSPIGNTRGTNPPFYFGGSYATGSVGPRKFSQIPNASKEWMTADAWYRPRSNAPVPFLQQEGTYQSAWSGEAMPNFAPHLRRAGTSYSYSTDNDRATQSARIRQQKSDGVTDTLFFDGHAAPVASRTAELNDFQLLYGFPGTVNPELTSTAYQNMWNRLSWY